MGWFSNKSTKETPARVDASELEALRTQVAELTQRLETADGERAKLARHIVLVDQMLAAKSDPTPVDGAPRPAAADEVDERFAAIDQRLSGVDEANQQTAYKLATLDDRMSSIGTELTNQLTELGRDIDALADLPSTQPDPADLTARADSTEQIDRLADGQVKLAKEQARYEIAFREELAIIAEQVRKNTPR